MPILLKDIIEADPKKAVEVATSLFKGRRTADHVANTEFCSGNHWQNGNGWIGEKPILSLEGLAGAAIGMEKIRLGLVSENVIAEVNDRHVGGILGREVNFDFVNDDLFRLRRKKVRELPEKDLTSKQVDEDLTGWWNEGRPKDKLKEALSAALNEEKALLRYFIPRGLRDANGQIPAQSKLTDALGFLYTDVVYADKGGVFVDSDTQKEFGLYVYQQEEKTVVEISWVDKGVTFLQILSDDPNLATDKLPCDLGGRLWMYELKRKPLITEQIRSLQRSLNLADTMMIRNVNLAGSRERYFFNVARPTTTVRVTDATQPSGYREEQRPAAVIPTGVGASIFFDGVLIKDQDGKIVDRADPNISITDPVDITTFKETRGQCYEAMLSQCQQIHALISKDATASGVSREQARAEFESSLRLSKEVVDDAGRWMMETGLRLAAHLCNQTSTYAGLRCDFNSIIETGPVSPEERTANRDDVKAGLMSKETAMSRNGQEDTDAEKARIEEDKVSAPDPPIPPIPKKPNGDSEVVQ